MKLSEEEMREAWKVTLNTEVTGRKFIKLEVVYRDGVQYLTQVFRQPCQNWLEEMDERYGQ